MKKWIPLLAVSVFCLPINPVLFNIPDTAWMLIPNSYNPNANDIIVQSGTSYDPTHNRIICHGGGHATEHFGNDVWVFDLQTMEWTQLYTPDACAEYAKSSSGLGVLPSGRPWVSHTYDHHEFADHLGKLFYFQGTGGGFNKSCSGLGYAFARNTWIFNFTSNAWEFKNPTGTPPEASYSGGSVTSVAIAYDPVTQKVYGDRQGTMYIYDFSANHWTKTQTNGSSHGGIETNMVCAPDFGKIVKYGANYPMSSTISVYDIATKTWTQPNPSPNPGQRKEIGMTYDTLHKKVVVFGSGTGTNSNKDLWFYDVEQNTWTNVGASNPPSSAWGSLHYDKVNNVFISVQQASGQLEVWAFKLNDEGFGQSSVSEDRESGGDLEVSVYPNPFRSLTAINVCAKRKEKKGKIMIYDIRGKLVEEKSFLFPPSLFPSFSWDASNYAKGIYVMRVSIGANRHYYKILSVTQ